MKVNTHSSAEQQEVDNLFLKISNKTNTCQVNLMEALMDIKGRASVKG